MKRYKSTSQPRRLAIAIGLPPSPEIEYFKETLISVIVTNHSKDRLLVESIILRFQSDAEASSLLTEEQCGWTIDKDEQKEQRIRVSPTPIYLANTNRFDVLAQYRILRARSGNLIPEKHQGSYLILRKPIASLGKVFISFKQPENLALARMLNTLAERAGFEPYRAVQDPTPGKSLWERITPEIEGSVALFVIWSKHTLWGDGVQREIDIARKAKVPIVLLLEQGLEPPDKFDLGIEYMTFDPQDPASKFAESVQARRKFVLAARH